MYAFGFQPSSPADVPERGGRFCTEEFDGTRRMVGFEVEVPDLGLNFQKEGGEKMEC